MPSAPDAPPARPTQPADATPADRARRGNGRSAAPTGPAPHPSSHPLSHTPSHPPSLPASTSFASTGLPELPPAEMAASQAAATLDVCHVGVVLRTLLAVHAAIALGVGFAAASWADAAMGLMMAMSVSVPAVLLWLVVACALRRQVTRLRPAAQHGAMALLGAACALAAGWPQHVWLGPVFAWAHPAALAASGLAAGAVVFEWLQLRARALMPALTAARLAELQARIRPHFLFNTLNTAIALVRVDPARAETLLEDLAELFRVALADARSVVTLDDEIALARRYLEIEQVRFGPRLQVEWDLDPAAGPARLPPLLLQPLLENAVRHGIEPAAGGGLVRIRTRVKRGQVQVAISNTLGGAPSQPGHGLALDNVRERLQLMHDVAARLETVVREGRYHVRIVVPLA